MADAPSDRPSPLDDFLSRNTISTISGKLPLVHSTKSLNLRELINDAGLSPADCKVYEEKLLYFFLGRPAYRWRKPEGQPQHWELPTCFVFDDLPALKVERVLPFDSGGHANGIYPSYIQNIPRKNFETKKQDAPNRLISAVYGSFGKYVRGEPKSEEKLAAEFDLTVLDAEMLAIRKLASDGTPEGFDDRRFSIEVQTRSSVDFDQNPPSAVILPTNYLAIPDIAQALKDWGAEPINYDLYGLSLPLYYGAIFIKFMDYCKSKGFSV